MSLNTRHLNIFVIWRLCITRIHTRSYIDKILFPLFYSYKLLLFLNPEDLVYELIAIDGTDPTRRICNLANHYRDLLNFLRSGLYRDFKSQLHKS